MIGHRWRIPFHPLLVAAYPILFLAAANVREMQLVLAIRALVLSVLAAAALIGILWLVIRRLDPAGAIASALLLAFFSYGHIYDQSKTAEIGGVLLGRHRLLVPLVGLAVVGVIAWSVRKRTWQTITPALNLTSIVLAALPLITIGRFMFATRDQPGPHAIPPQNPTRAVASLEQPPDIYYIILDAYTRRDVLRTTFGVDNSPFLDELRDLGFVIPACSMSNYSQTELTLASTLNMAYLDDLGDGFSAGSKDRTRLSLLIRNSLVRRILESHGYRTIAFETGYRWSEWTGADAYYSPGQRNTGLSDLGVPLNAFESLLLESTALRAAFDARIALPSLLAADLQDPIQLDRRRTLYVLDQLPLVVESPGPKLVFAHIVAPHRPYVFQPEPGSPLAQQSLIPGFDVGQDSGYITGYRNQVLYLNDRMSEILRQMVTGADSGPIIIVQGDHGADDAPPADRMANFTALYLPDVRAAEIPTVLTPVNQFRLILRDYFGYELALLSTRSAWSPYDSPYDFTPIPVFCP